MPADIVIIGAGMAGLSCARRLAAAGHRPLVLDKGRGIGGRLAMRRVALEEGEMRFDHGAQYARAKSPGFASLLESLGSAVARWEGAAEAIVGVPGMSNLARALAEGLEVRTGVEVSGLTQSDGWRIEAGTEHFTARHLVLAVPAPQAAKLLAAHPELTAPLGHVRMAPSLTLLAAFPADAPRPFLTRTDSGPLAWIAQDSSKPGRSPSHTGWVAQASAAWSEAHLVEADPATIAATMLPLLADAIGASPQDAVYAAAHRWRYAHTATPLGQPFLRSSDRTLHIGGDWCLGPTLEAAWQSGEAIAADLLATER
jgi:predicted NAD/FAD-dependent oxidoreductase